MSLPVPMVEAWVVEPNTPEATAAIGRMSGKPTKGTLRVLCMGQQPDMPSGFTVHGPFLVPDIAEGGLSAAVCVRLSAKSTRRFARTAASNMN